MGVDCFEVMSLAIELVITTQKLQKCFAFSTKNLYLFCLEQIYRLVLLSSLKVDLESRGYTDMQA